MSGRSHDSRLSLHKLTVESHQAKPGLPTPARSSCLISGPRRFCRVSCVHTRNALHGIAGRIGGMMHKVWLKYVSRKCFTVRIGKPAADGRGTTTHMHSSVASQYMPNP